MRKLFVLVAMLATMSAQAQSESYKCEGNTYTSVRSNAWNNQDVRANARQTQFDWQDSEGKHYPIWVCRTGSCFVILFSEGKGKEYRKWLGREISADVCAKLGMQYNPTKNK